MALGGLFGAAERWGDKAVSPGEAGLKEELSDLGRVNVVFPPRSRRGT